MKEKHKKKKKNRKLGLKSCHQSIKKKSVPFDSPINQKIAGTTTGEIFQPMRLHYEISSLEDFTKNLLKLECIDYDPENKRWVWLYMGESRSLNLERKINKDRLIVLGEFLYKQNKEIVLNVRAFERGYEGVEFFDKYIPREIAKLTHVTVCSKLFNVGEVSAIESLDQYFEETETQVKNPEESLKKLKEAVSKAPGENPITIMNQILNEHNNELPELEKYPVYFYEEGIDSLKMQLHISKTVAVKRWEGNTSYTATDVINEGIFRSSNN